MRDVIWTIIAVWLIYKLVEVFKAGKSRDGQPTASNSKTSYTAHNESASRRDEMKSAARKHVNNEGEYVDFEEIK
jgi:hypothetical protein